MDRHDPKLTNGWANWSRHVLAELQRIDRAIEKMDESVHSQKLEMMRSIERIRSDIVLLKFQASLWGSAAGIITGAVTAFLVSKLN